MKFRFTYYFILTQDLCVSQNKLHKENIHNL
jgi:hypothetical protein